MVKKTSILDRLKSRWKASPVRIDAAREVGPLPAESERLGEALATPLAERVAGRKVPPREEALLAMGEGFRELNQLVRGVQARMETQGERARALADDVKALPALGQAQLDLLRQMASQLARQSSSNERLLEVMGDVPQTLREVKVALERVAETDARTATTLSDFRRTMDRIEGAMQGMVLSTAAQAEAAQQLVADRRGERDELASALRRGQTEEADRLAEVVAKAGADQLAAVRQLQNAQSARLDRLASDGSRWGNVVVTLLALTFLAMAGVLAKLLLG